MNSVNYKMPLSKCSNGKWKIGSGDCIYSSKEKAEQAYKGYLATKYEEIKYETKNTLKDLDIINKKLIKAKKYIKKVVSKNGSNK